MPRLNFQLTTQPLFDTTLGFFGLCCLTSRAELHSLFRPLIRPLARFGVSREVRSLVGPPRLFRWNDLKPTGKAQALYNSRLRPHRMYFNCRTGRVWAFRLKGKEARLPSFSRQAGVPVLQCGRANRHPPPAPRNSCQVAGDASALADDPSSLRSTRETETADHCPPLAAGTLARFRYAAIARSEV